MERRFTRKRRSADGVGGRPQLLLVLTVLAFLVSAGSVNAAGPLAVLPGHLAPQIKSSLRQLSVSPTENVGLSLVVSVDQALMSQTLAQIYQSSDPLHRNFLTPAQFAQKFNLAFKRQALKSFAQSSGLSLDGPDDPNSLIVKVSGPANAVQNAFNVHLYYYQHTSGQIFRANDSDPMIPTSLSPHLLAVLGLSNFMGALKPHIAFPRPGLSPSSVSGQVSPAGVTGTGPGPGLAPADIQTIYGLSGSLNGSGQTLALLELDGYAPSDIQSYKSQFGLPTTPVTFVSVDGQSNLCGSLQNQTCNATTASADNGMTEVAMDIELMIAVASGASDILVYTPPNTGQGVLDGYAKMANDDIAKVISTSWGLDEEDEGGSAMASESTIFQQMATQGQTIFAAAGDNGAYDASGGGQTWAGNLLTDDPASQPYVTGVGGTSLSGAIGGAITETVWNNGCSSPVTSCVGGGGGVANYGVYWPIPSYQNGVAGEFSTSDRNVPDVALNADPNAAPYSVYVGGSWSLIGGTSAAAPLWAAFTARVNQLRSSEGSASLGFANPALYPLAEGSSYGATFNDITSGNNGYYNAGTGYDNASGWGSFKGNVLISALSPLPAPQNVAASMIGLSSITWIWSPVVGVSSYNVYSATNSAFLANVPASVSSFTLTSLPPNTTEALQISAVNVMGQEGAANSPAYAVTLATPVFQNNVTPQIAAFISSASVSYSICSPSSYCAGYLFEASTAPDFTGILASSSTENPALNSLTVSGLFTSSTYYMRLGSLNWSLSPNYISLGSTDTLIAPAAIQVFTSSGGAVTFLGHDGLITLTIPPGAFNSDVTVNMNTSSTLGNQACSIPPGQAMTDEGIGVDVLLSPALQPALNATISISYLGASFPPGVNPADFLISRCDASVGVWIPLISNADVSQSVVTATTDRFSIFELRGISTLASSVKNIEISNNPIRPARGIANTTLSNLPPNSRIRIYTISGLLVKDISADATGVAKWDATNQSGRQVSSGVYFVFVQGGGTRATLKIAVQR